MDNEGSAVQFPSDVQLPLLQSAQVPSQPPIHWILGALSSMGKAARA